MPLSDSDLSTKIQTEIVAQFGIASSAATLKKFADAVAKAVNDEIRANALVTGTVTTGAGAGGAVTGTVS